LSDNFIEIHGEVEKLEQYHVLALHALQFLVKAQVVCMHDTIVECDVEGCCNKSKQTSFVLVDSLAAVSVVAAYCQLSRPKWDALEWCCDRYSHELLFNPDYRSQRLKSSQEISKYHEMAAKLRASRIQNGPRIQNAVIANAAEKQTGSNASDLVSGIPVPTVERYRRRSPPQLSHTAYSPTGGSLHKQQSASSSMLLKKTSLSRSGMLCLANTPPGSERKLRPVCQDAETAHAKPSPLAVRAFTIRDLNGPP
jgi:hypothetical protein